MNTMYGRPLVTSLAACAKCMCSINGGQFTSSDNICIPREGQIATPSGMRIFVDLLIISNRSFFVKDVNPLKNKNRFRGV